MKQDAYTSHKPIRHHFKRNRVIVGGIDQQWLMDLADMHVKLLQAADLHGDLGGWSLLHFLSEHVVHAPKV